MRKILQILKKRSVLECCRVFLRRTIFKNGVPCKTSKYIMKIENNIGMHVSDIVFPIQLQELLNSCSQYKEEQILKGANFVLANKTNCLIATSIQLEANFDWSNDYLVNLKFPASQQKIKEKQGDIKRVWELSRMHQLTPLLKAFYLSKKHQYLDKIYYLVNSWFEQNYNKKDPHWLNPMEISIRAVNLIFILNSLEQLTTVAPKFREQVNKILLKSGFEIRYNLENSFFTLNNHYISDLVGLLTIGLYFNSKKNFRSAHKWITFSVSRLKREVKRQVFDDGVSYEISTAYHSYVFELLSFTQKILEANRVLAPQELLDTTEKMGFFLQSIASNSCIPFIGDNDNSRLLRLSDEYPFEKTNDIFFLMKFFASNNNKFINKNDTKKIKFFPDAGYYVLNNSDLKVLFVCGKLSCNGEGGHSHNDQLSFCLWYKGHPIISDPGTFCYTSSWYLRNLYRSTSLHSTVQIESYEQNTFRTFFTMPDETKSRIELFNENVVQGSHLGYVKKCGAVHRRKVTLLNNGIEVFDSIENYSGIAKSYLIFNPNVSMTGRFTFKGGANCFRVETEDTKAIDVEQVCYSESYGQTVSAIKLTISFSKKLNYKIIFQ